MRKILLSLFAVSLLVVSCGPSQEELTRERIRGLSKMAELGTVEYTVKKIIKPKEDDWWLDKVKIGKRKIIFTCTAFIKAGIKMEGFSEEKVMINQEEKSISVVLPRAEVLSFNMPPEEITEEFSKVTGFRFDFSLDEKQRLLVLGEEDIREDIPNMGILEDAEANAKLFFTALFTQLGYEKIDVKFE